MTLSLIHFNPRTGLSASITATGGVAVGGYVNHSWRGLGACATQGLFTNPWYAEKARSWLSQGLNCDDVIKQIKQSDIDYNQRQLMVMDNQGRCAFINGEENIAHVGSLAWPHIAVSGNMLANHKVVTIFARTFLSLATMNAKEVEKGMTPLYREDYEKHLPATLISSLEEAVRVGGDSRGTYSASLRIESYTTAPIDIRVDWADSDLISSLRQVLSRVEEKSFQTFLSKLPTQ